MEITEVRIKLMDDNNDRLCAFCSITLDHEFVIRDLKVIDGPNGPFVAMPSRKVMSRCSHCHYKNDLKARYCQNCGKAQPAAAAKEGNSRSFIDIAHPINASCRQKIQTAVLSQLATERLRAAEPGYVCNYDDFSES